MKRFPLLLLAIFLAAPFAAAQKMTLCGPDVHHSTKRVKQRAKIEMAAPPSDKAMVYVVRPTRYGAGYQTKLSMDGNWVGVNKGDSYFVFLADPGRHEFCSQAENASRLTLNLEAGKIYYLQQHVRTGMWKAQNELSQLDDSAGRLALGKCQRMIFWEKGKPRPSD
jgi:hypothetical protein